MSVDPTGARPRSVLHRRNVLAGVGVVAAAARGWAQPAPPRLPVPPGGRLGFRIMRHGSKIGEHNSTFETDGDLLTVRADVDIVVRFLGVAVFRYAHHVIERWRDGRFIALETRTNDDGNPFSVNVQRDPGGLTVNASAGLHYTAPADALPMTHWNMAELKVPKINPQKGDLLRPVVTERGPMPVRTASGGTITARRYNFRGEAILDVWFDADDRWAALAFLGSDQSQITLERL